MIFLRTDTVEKQKEDKPVDYDRQQICFGLAVRGEGKSQLMEAEVSKEFFAGFTPLDLHAPPNLENGFWAVPNLNPDENLSMDELKKVYKKYCKDPQPFIKDGNPIPITIFCSESLVWDETARMKYNGMFYTEEEWNEEHPDKIFNLIYPPIKPARKQGRELVRFVVLPQVTKKEDSETNLKAVEIITKTILENRVERRIGVLNRMSFGTENQYFWTMELIHRSLYAICEQHFGIKVPEDFGLEKYSEMKPWQLRWNRLTVFHRELSDLAPAKLKADKSGESTPVKKSLLGFARICRHWEIDWFADWQHNNSVEGGIRDQADNWFFKKYNRDLGGEDKKGVFDRITYLRDAIITKGKNSKIAHQIANSIFPKLEELGKKYFYCKFLSGNLRLFKVPKLVHQHKEPWMKFEEVTGIWLHHDKSKIQTESAVTSLKVSKSDEMAVFNIMWTLKNPANGKFKGWKYLQDKLIEHQENKTINYPQQFREISNPTLQKKYQRLAEKFGEPLVSTQ